jgi:hypothetical protein
MVVGRGAFGASNLGRAHTHQPEGDLAIAPEVCDPAVETTFAERMQFTQDFYFGLRTGSTPARLWHEELRARLPLTLRDRGEAVYGAEPIGRYRLVEVVELAEMFSARSKERRQRRSSPMWQRGERGRVVVNGTA